MVRFTLALGFGVIVGCSSAAPAASNTTTAVAATSVSISTTTPSPPKVVPVETRERIGSLPFTIEPLNTSTAAPRLSIADITSLMPIGPGSRFFQRPSDITTATIKLGLITDHSVDDGTTANDPTFVGYVVEGGHAMCPADGPPTSDGENSPDFPCHALFILNGETGRYAGSFSEVGD